VKKAEVALPGVYSAQTQLVAQLSLLLSRVSAISSMASVLANRLLVSEFRTSILLHVL